METSSDLAGGVMECSKCSRFVPVPSLMSCSHGDAGCLPALPPDILALDMKILCSTCDTRIELDARWEGRMVTCPICGTEFRVPHWSLPSRPAVRTAATPLSADEIEFLSAPVAV